jgi:sterol desaturase/sphingolipid hydroxylase (fatty acid hydroxylase superfamily)
MLDRLFQPENLEVSLRLGFFVGVLVLLAVCESLAPRRRLRVSKAPRWFSNLGLVALNGLSLRLLMPVGLIGVALYAQSQGWGLLNVVSLSAWLSIAISVIALDLAMYLQHVMFHAVPLLWRLHMVHHADLDFDVSTGIRFHTIEILLSFWIKSAAVILLGAPAMGVLIFEILLNATSLFNHSNVHVDGRRILPRLRPRAHRPRLARPDAQPRAAGAQRTSRFAPRDASWRRRTYHDAERTHDGDADSERGRLSLDFASGGRDSVSPK